MESHRYVRRKLSDNPWDGYNAFVADRSSSAPLEYWTNGKTTLLSSDFQQVAGQHQAPPPLRGNTMKSSSSEKSMSSSSSPASNVVRNSLLSGSVAGMASTLAMHPMDVVRTKMQSSALVVGTSAQSNYQPPLQVFRHTLQHGGFRALYTGLTVPLLAQAVYKGTVFTVNNVVLEKIQSHRTWENQKQGILEKYRITMTDRFLAGCAGGGVNALLFVTPVEFIRNQLIAQHSKIAAGQHVGRLVDGSWDLVRHAVKEHGIKSLWRGVGTSVARDSIGCGCFFLAMSWAQRRLTPPNEKPPFSVTVASGGMAGLAFWLSCLPLDTLKTIIQSSDLQKSVSAREAIQSVYRQHGVGGLVQQLFRGWQVAYGRGIPAAAITISVYSTVYADLEQ